MFKTKKKITSLTPLNPRPRLVFFFYSGVEFTLWTRIFPCPTRIRIRSASDADAVSFLPCPDFIVSSIWSTIWYLFCSSFCVCFPSSIHFFNIDAITLFRCSTNKFLHHISKLCQLFWILSSSVCVYFSLLLTPVTSLILMLSLFLNATLMNFHFSSLNIVYYFSSYPQLMAPLTSYKHTNHFPSYLSISSHLYEKSCFRLYYFLIQLRLVHKAG